MKSHNIQMMLERQEKATEILHGINIFIGKLDVLESFNKADFFSPLKYEHKKDILNRCINRLNKKYQSLIKQNL